MHSICIDRIRTRNVKVPNLIECALSQSTSVCGLNPVRSGLEWNVGGRSLRHMTEVCTCIRAQRSVRRNAVDGCRLRLCSKLGIWGDANVQNQLNGIVRNKAIYQKVATAMAELGYSCTWRRAKLPVAQRHEHRHENEIHLFSPCHMTVT